MYKNTLLLAVLVAFLTFRGHPSDAAGQPRRDSADTAPIEVSHCRLNFVHRATLASGQPGILAAVPLKEGMTVKQDAPVARIADDVAKAQLAIAEQEASNKTDVLYARKAEEVAKTELEKARLANRDVPGTVPEIEVLRLKLAADRSTLQIQVAEHKLKVNELTVALKKAELASLQIKAPFAGTVTQVFKHQGEAVRQGDPILELVNPQVVRAEALIAWKDTLAIRTGDRVELVLDAPESNLPIAKRTFSGTISFIDAAVEPVGRRVRVWANVTNRNGLLRAGLPARLIIYPGGKK